MAALIAEFAIWNIDMLAAAAGELRQDGLTAVSAERGPFWIFRLAFWALHRNRLPPDNALVYNWGIR